MAALTAANVKNHDDDGGVQSDVEEMKAEGHIAEKLPEQEERKGHQRAVIIGGSGGADKRPDGGSENLREILPAFDVGILQDLLLVVVDVIDLGVQPRKHV